MQTGIWTKQKDWTLLAHELTHADQCYKWGGKNRYVAKTAWAYGGTGVKKVFKKKKNRKNFKVPKEAGFEKAAYSYGPKSVIKPGNRLHRKRFPAID